jgi:hypothetical protein
MRLHSPGFCLGGTNENNRREQNHSERGHRVAKHTAETFGYRPFHQTPPSSQSDYFLIRSSPITLGLSVESPILELFVTLYRRGCFNSTQMTAERRLGRQLRALGKERRGFMGL